MPCTCSVQQAVHRLHMDTASASDGYDSGVDDASDADSDIEERRVDSLINKYL